MYMLQCTMYRVLVVLSVVRGSMVRPHPTEHAHKRLLLVRDYGRARSLSAICRLVKKRTVESPMGRKIIFAALAAVAVAQDYGESYQDYAYGEQDDGLYANYAAKQQEKAIGGGGPGIGKVFMACGLGWIAGAKIHSGRATNKMVKKHKADQKKLYTQYYNDVHKLQESNAELESYIKTLGDAIKGLTEEHELEQVQRDYDEFKQPDIDGDDRISRAEFNMYVRDYLSNYPGMTQEDYPKFDDFDHDGDGYIGFKEYSEQMALAIQKAEKEQTKLP